MKKILFVCHGNICRSPMAEAVMQQLLAENNLTHAYQADSAAATRDAEGETIDPRAARVLEKNHVLYNQQRRARIMTKADYQKYEYLIAMDEENFDDMNQITAGDPDRKEHKLLEFAGSYADIDDPWYTNDFDTAYAQIRRGCVALVKKLKQEKDE